MHTPENSPTSPTKSRSEPKPDPTESDRKTPSFADLGLNDRLLKALERLKFETPTEIQAELIPLALKGRDLLGQAKTGTGKTAAFVIPMLQNFEPGARFQGLILVPTRELARQVCDHIKELAWNQPIKTALLYGGQRIPIQQAQLKAGPEIVIGTPGRVLDFMRRGAVKFDKVRIAVLDEVDRMLDIGFRDDIRRILREVSSDRQTIFVSATFDEEITKLARTFMRDPVEVNVSRDVLTVESIEQGFVTVERHDKFATLLGFIKHEAPTLAIVFTNTKMAARKVARRLREAGVKCKEIHGDLMQHRRDHVMNSFRKSQIQILVATDLASRGIDVMEVSHIVNYDLPPDASVYVHRVGRTARMGNTGYAMSFVPREEGKLLTAIEMHINKELLRIEASWVVDRGPRDPVEAAAATKPKIGSRLTEALMRDPVLESMGLRPVRRTLGSRFRNSRRGRR